MNNNDSKWGIGIIKSRDINVKIWIKKITDKKIERNTKY